MATPVCCPKATLAIPSVHTPVISSAEDGGIGEGHQGSDGSLATGNGCATGTALLPPANSAFSPSGDPIPIGQHGHAPNLIVPAFDGRAPGLSAVGLPAPKQAIAACGDQIAVPITRHRLEGSMASGDGPSYPPPARPKLQGALVPRTPPPLLIQGHQPNNPSAVAGLNHLTLGGAVWVPEAHAAITAATDEAPRRSLGQAPDLPLPTGKNALKEVFVGGLLQTHG